MTPSAEFSDSQEARRLRALRRYAILDSPPEQEFDELARLAADIFGVPIALISLLDDTRQWFKSRIGLHVSETPRAFAFCDHAIRGLDVLEVNDATQDTRFDANPLVTGAPHIRFYAGAPLTTSDGYSLGTLCVIDREPRVLSDRQRHTLAGLARLAMRQLELRLEGRRQAMEAAYQRALFESAAVAIIATDPGGIVTRMNPAAERLVGWPREEVVGIHTPILFHDPHEVRQRADDLSGHVGRTIAPGVDFFQALLASGQPHTSDWTFVRRDGGRVAVKVSVGPVRDADGHIVGFLGVVDDVNERRSALDDARRSEARFRALSVSAPVGIFQTDAAGQCIYTNARWQELAGVSETDALGDGWADAIVPEDRHEVITAWSESARTRTEFSREFRMRGKGTPRWVHSRARAILSEVGEVLGHVGTVEDVTDRRAAEDATQLALHEKEVLLREIHHRVKNNLQVISSLLRLQGKRVRDPRDMAPFDDARERMRSMILVHELLYQSNNLTRIDLSDYLARLLRDLVPSGDSAHDSPDVRLECAPLDVHPDQALPLGMMITELVTNALKYAYRSGPPGTIDVKAHEVAGRLLVSVSDKGGGIPAEVDLTRPESFGWQLIRLLASQLEADVHDRRSPGTCVQISIPLKRVS